MFYLNADLLEPYVHSVSAHEFQHLINFSQKYFVYQVTTTLESTRINEGLSMVAMDVAGYGYQANVQTPYAGSFFRNPDAVSLYNWGGDLATYGAAWLFLRYVADRFTDAALTNIVQSNQVGVPNLERVTQEPVGRTLLYSGVAMMVSTEGLQITDPRWTYRSVSLANIGRITYGTTGTNNARSLGFNFVKVSSGGQPAVRVTVTDGTLRPYAAPAR